MKRYGQVIGLNPEKLHEYSKYHKEVWPEVEQKIKECNIRNYSIFHISNSLFAYFEYIGTDFDKDMNLMAEDKMTQKWWKIMKPMQQPLEERKDGEWWASMTEVFHQD